jgi:hypothetical protein
VGMGNGNLNDSERTNEAETETKQKGNHRNHCKSSRWNLPRRQSIAM